MICSGGMSSSSVGAGSETTGCSVDVDGDEGGGGVVCGCGGGCTVCGCGGGGCTCTVCGGGGGCTVCGGGGCTCTVCGGGGGCVVCDSSKTRLIVTLLQFFATLNQCPSDTWRTYALTLCIGIISCAFICLLRPVLADWT